MINQELQLKINLVRQYCLNVRDSITHVQLRSGTVSYVPNKPVLSLYANFLQESDGSRFGIIDLFRSRDLDERQGELVQLGVTEYSTFGQVLYQPLVFENLTGKVFLIKSDSEVLMELSPRFDEFINEYAMGNKYSLLCPNPSSDRWWQAMRRVLLPP